MCGFSGYLGGVNGGRGILSAMGATIAHRGPDDSGVWLDESSYIGLCHQRLSILDTTVAGHQPMVSASGRYVVVFNGEIYNHLELKEKINNKNYNGHSDTEVLLACFDEWGVVEALNQAVGMFAFALWDTVECILYLARDRFGEKPLYYGWQGSGANAVFLFGSELRALRAHPSFVSDIDKDALALFLRYRYVPSPHSIYQDIYKLLPGKILSVSLKQREPDISSYWSSDQLAINGSRFLYHKSDDVILNDLESLLMKAVRQQMASDVPLGAFLSGGIDSSLIVALMQKESGNAVKTFTIGFYEDQYNEAHYAKTVAEYLKTDHTELYLSKSDVINAIHMLPQVYDEPFADSSQIPTYLISKHARNHVSVCLTGDAGDELFCGYNRYIMIDKYWGVISKFPTSIRRYLGNILSIIPPNILGKVLHFVSHGDVSGKAYKIGKALGMSSVDQVYSELVSDWSSSHNAVLNGNANNQLLFGRIKNISGLNDVQKMMLLDLLTYLPDDILTKVDRAAMGVSLETRVPFLDHNVVEFAWHLPMNFKIRNGSSKWVLRQLLYKHVPRKLLERPKMGFGVPIDSWLRGPLRDWAEELLREDRLKQEGFFNDELIRQKWLQHLSGERNWQYHLWSVLMFQSWYESQ